MSLIQTNNLKKSYVTGKNVVTQALRGVDLSIEKKDFVVIAGPSGSGKSTLLHLIGALDKASEGEVCLDGEKFSEKSNEELSSLRLHKIGFVFQAYNLINTLTAVENAEYIMLLQGIAADKRRAKAIDMLKKVGLGEYLNRFPNEMSGGQQQRVTIARAMAGEPKIILADEPTANLDSQTAENLINLMLELNKDKEMTFVISSHDKMVIDKSKKTIFIKDGLLTT
jgi:putative ABC transport system ATP-binding protein